MKVYNTASGIVSESDGQFRRLTSLRWDELFRRSAVDLLKMLRNASDEKMGAEAIQPPHLLPPIGSQEVWAAGVTYLRSRQARMEESNDAGGGDFYDRVYDAARPELFFKATPHRVVGTGQLVRIRSDSKWNVPEPELALMISSGGAIVGYTVGNDMSSRDIEGENPLYLPQAKVYDGSCALGPCVLISASPPPPETRIVMQIQRAGRDVFQGETSLAKMKRELSELVQYLFRHNGFPNGCFLLTGTGVVPPDEFALQSGDEISISIEPIGTLRNSVA